MIKKWALALILVIAAVNYAGAKTATSDEWLSLLHYRPVGNGYVSTIDADNFFVAPDGKNNPHSEWAATINLFEKTQDNKKKCLFPARYKLLAKKGLVHKPMPECKELMQFYKDLQPAGVTLLFTDAYMNNPSSLFGHTLLRIDTARKGTQLLAHGANYGAFTGGQENSVLFALRGLTGGYWGGFTIKPYYDVINMYNNIENRDIWEIGLNLNPQELDFLVAHLWELGHSQSRYYFFGRNCSYMLMETLDAVRPSLKLADVFHAQTIPLDTLKEVAKRRNLVKEIKYRPSRQAKIKHNYRLMNEKQKQAYVKVIKQQNYKIDNLSESEKADVWETAYQFVQYQYVAEKLKLDEYRRQSFRLLLERNKLQEKSKLPPLQKGRSPLHSHEAMRINIGGGFANGEAIQEISYRPAYHSLTDNNFGFLKGAEINFLNTDIRHYDEQNKTVLQQFDLLGIRSLAPIDAMFQPMSYNINVGVTREMSPEAEKYGYVFNIKVGGGATYAWNDNLWTYINGNTYAVYGGFLPRNQYAGFGTAIGLYADVNQWKLLAEAEKIWATSHWGEKVKYKVEGAYSLNRNSAVAVEYDLQKKHGKDEESAVASIRYYF